MSSKKVKKVVYLKRWYKTIKTIKTVKPVSNNMSSPELLEFLRKAGLEHLYQVFTDEGMDLKYLLLANEEDLKCLAPRMIDRIKLRNAMDSNNIILPSASAGEGSCKSPLSVERSFILTESSSCENSPSVLPGEDISVTEIPSLVEVDRSVGQSTPLPLPESIGQSTSQLLPDNNSASSSLMVVGGGVRNLTDWVQEEWQFVQEIGPLEDKKHLKELLELTTFGKCLLQKQGQPLTPKDRKGLVQLIVEHQLRILPSIKDTIRL